MKEKKKEASVFKKKQAFERYKRFLKLGKNVALGVFIVSFLWISIDGYHRLVSRQLVEESSHLIKPLSPQMKVEALDKIKLKEHFSIEDVDDYFNNLKAVSFLQEEAEEGKKEGGEGEIELEEGEESSASGENEQKEEISEE